MDTNEPSSKEAERLKKWREQKKQQTEAMLRLTMKKTKRKYYQHESGSVRQQQQWEAVQPKSITFLRQNGSSRHEWRKSGRLIRQEKHYQSLLEDALK